MILGVYIAAAIVLAVVTLYLAWRYGPLLGTEVVVDPATSGGRSFIHFVLCLYFGFVRKPRS